MDLPAEAVADSSLVSSMWSSDQCLSDQRLFVRERFYVVDSSVFSKPSVKDVNKAPFPVVNVIADAPGTAGADSLRRRLDTFRAGMSNWRGAFWIFVEHAGQPRQAETQCWFWFHVLFRETLCVCGVILNSYGRSAFALAMLFLRNKAFDRSVVEDV
jgi:hypothetical protein